MPEALPPATSDSWEEKMVELSSIDPSPFQVRSTFDGIESLAESIRTHGLLTPILARPVNGRLQAVTGGRRCKAIALLGQNSIRARIKPMSDDEALVLAITDNEQREETNLIEKARGYKLMRDAPHNYTYEKIGAEFGKPASTVYEIIELLDQPEQIQMSNDRNF